MVDDPILSRRNLNVCASCHQQPDRNINNNSSTNLKKDNLQSDYHFKNNKNSPRFKRSKDTSDHNLKRVISIEINNNLIDVNKNNQIKMQNQELEHESDISNLNKDV